MTISTVKEYADQELESILRLVSSSTAGAYERGYRLKIMPALGHLRLDELTPRVIEDAYHRWPGKPSTKGDALAILSRLLKRAVRDGHMVHNPVRDIEKPRLRSEQHVPKALTRQELATLFDLVPEHYHLFFGLMAFAGLRFGEAAGIFSHDIDLDNRLITVARQLHREGDLAPTKSGHTRITPISDDLLELIPGHVSNMAPQTLLNRTPAGYKLHSSNVSRAIAWRDIRDRIRPGLRYHDLRHHAASAFIAAGIPLNAVQAFMGHSNIAVTSRYVVAGRAEALAALPLLSTHATT